MSEDERKQEKMEVLYEIEELSAEMGCIRSKLLGVATVFKELADAVPGYANPKQGTTPGQPRVQHYPTEE